MENKTSVTVLVKEKDCKGSVRFGNKDVTSAITSIYISRGMEGIQTANKIKVTIEVVS